MALAFAVCFETIDRSVKITNPDGGSSFKIDFPKILYPAVKGQFIFSGAFF